MTLVETSDLAAPAVHTKITPLRVLGTSVTQVPAVREAAEADLGIALEFITLDGAAAQRRGALEPLSFDVYDQWFHDLEMVWPTGSLQPIEISRLRQWDEINELPKTGRLGPEVHRAAGGNPSQHLYVQPDGRLGNTPTSYLSMIPTVHNADGFAVLGDDNITSWSAMLDPEHAGRVLLHADPAIGAFDILLALQAKGEMRAANIADLTLAEVDSMIDHLARYHRNGQFSTVWSDETEAIQAVEQGGAMIGSLWWSGAIRLKALGVPIRMISPDEGCRGWFGGIGLSTHLSGRATDAAYEFINWWLEGGPGEILSRNGAYLANHSAVRAKLSPEEWDFWYGGKPARSAIRDADGREVYAQGECREGGSYAERMGRVVVWNSVMTEHNYLLRRWEDLFR